MATRNDLFTELLGIVEPDGITSDISFYTDGRATDVDYKNLIATAFSRTDTGSEARKAFIAALDGAGFFKEGDYTTHVEHDETERIVTDHQKLFGNFG